MTEPAPRTFRRLHVVAVCLVAVLAFGSAVHASLDDPVTVDAPAVRGTAARTDGGAPPRAVLISDSAISGIRWYGRQHFLTGTSWIASLESCRRLVAPSCRGREGYAPPTAVHDIARIRSEIGPPHRLDLLVIAVGYNDAAATFANDFTTTMNAATNAGFRRVAWLTYRTGTSYRSPSSTGATNYAHMNAVLEAAQASGDWPSLTVWDYDAITAPHDDWFYADGLHVTPSGAERVAEWLSGQLARPLP